jgi:hypothetical protein
MTAEDFERRKKEAMERLEKEVKILFYFILIADKQKGMERLKKLVKVYFLKRYSLCCLHPISSSLYAADFVSYQ